MMNSKAESRVRIGISSCLLGESVRFDAGHKRDPYINDVLARHFEYVPYCPEVAIGMGIPRPPIRLVGGPQQPRAIGVRVEGIDVTDNIIDYAHSVLADLPPISGYLFKRGSPSCGMERVKVYTDEGVPNASTSGLYAGIVIRALPNLPVEEEGRLNDPVLRENFVERVYVYDRWQRLCKERLTPARFVEFHTRNKLLLLSHSEIHYRRLGRLVADAGIRDTQELADEYVSILMDGLKRRATRRRHSNVLQHIMGYLKRSIDSGDKAELNRVIDEYRQGMVPLIVPMKLIDHHFRHHPDDYIALQFYLDPHPADLGLRNHL